MPNTRLPGDKISSARKRLMSLRKLSSRIRPRKTNPDFHLPPVAFTELFRYSDSFDKFLMVSGLLAALVQGSSLPVLLLIFGRVTDSFVNFASCMNATNANCTEIGSNETALKRFEEIPQRSFNIEAVMTTYAYYYVVIACLVIFCGFVQVHTWILASTRQTGRIRRLFFRAVMRQEIEWFDETPVGALNSRLNEDVNKIAEAIGDKFAYFATRLSTVVGGFVVGFVTGWRLTLIILAVSPVLGVGVALMSKFVASWTTRELRAYAKAGAVAENVLRNIRTVAAYGAEEKEVQRYNEKLGDAEREGLRKGLLFGVFQGFMWCVIFATYAMAFWYGSNLVLDPDVDFTVGRLITVFFSILVAATNLGNASPLMDVFTTGRSAAALVYHVIERKSKIDALSSEGKTLVETIGEIAFTQVSFRYSNRKNKVFHHLNLKFNTGETTAIVGPSGMGKSTILRLIQRLYDPNEGKITLDGEDIKNLNVRWLRQLIGVVQQEPVLFATTISENIRFGCDKCTEEDITHATRSANAFDFIMELPEKFNTMVGVGGCQLSGGQKQRIAIARALVRNPKILLLDQASSALDTQSEATLLARLAQTQRKRTTIMVTNRLTTIKAADVIVEVEHGGAVRSGSHDDLEKNDSYSALVGSQHSSPNGSPVVIDRTNDTISANRSGTDGNASPTPCGHDRIKKTGEMRPGDVQIGNLGYDECQEQVVSQKCSVANSVTKGAESDVVEDDDNIEPAPMSRILRLNSSEYPYIICGTVGALISGTIHPMFAVLLSALLGVYGSQSVEEIREGVNLFCSMLAGIAALTLVSNIFQQSMFAKSGEILTRRVRKMTFSAMLRQNIAWFDEPSNCPGILASRLASDAGYIQGAAGVQIGAVVSAATTVASALVVAFYFGWKLALVELSFFPLVVAAHAAQARMIHRGSQLDEKSMDAARNLVVETLGAFGTIAQLGKEDHFSAKYDEILGEIYRQGKKLAIIQGITFGIANSVMFFSSAATFRFGAYLVVNKEMTFDNVFRVFFVIVFVGITLGRSSRYTPDYTKARKAAARIFRFIDRTPTIDVQDSGGESWENFSGELELRLCDFIYPTRPDSLVLRGLDLNIEPGKTLALVGQSGCGKSTCMQLLERFYDPNKGQVLVDGCDVRNLNLKYLRSKIGIVFQEPVLFEGTVYDNIVYGDISQHSPSMEEVHEAAKIANIHDFIKDLEKGYNTNVGRGGNQFSRGQKQRIAIARALIRNPRILLLDEATSALDTANESIVQQALDNAREGRTSIVIAHRLSTIKNADKIAVMSQGKVIEQGTHEELLKRRGAYYALLTAGLTS